MPSSTDSIRIVRPGRHVAGDPFGSEVSPASSLSRLPLQSPPRATGSAQTRHWGPSDFERGDEVRYLSVWYEVLSVGPVGLTVRFRRPRDGSAWEVPAEYTKVTGRRRNGVEETDAA